MLEYELSIEEQDELLTQYDILSGLNLSDDERIVDFILQESGKHLLYKKMPVSIFLKEKFKGSLQDNLVALFNIPKVEKPYILTIIMGFLLGTVIKEYEGGVWLKTIKADPKQDEVLGSPSSKDRKEFLLHTDLSYTENPPPYFLFHCLRNSKSLGGMSTFCELDQVLSSLSSQTKRELSLTQFQFPAPHYYVESSCITRPILSSVEASASIRFREDGMKFLTRNGIEAVSELVYLLREKMKTLSVQEGMAVFINNCRCLHGRYAFLFSKQADLYRHFNQVYIAA